VIAEKFLLLPITKPLQIIYQQERFPLEDGDFSDRRFKMLSTPSNLELLNRELLSEPNDTILFSENEMALCIDNIRSILLQKPPVQSVFEAFSKGSSIGPKRFQLF
jgi:hypothetical protein